VLPAIARCNLASLAVDVPTAIFTGEYSDWLDSQRWMNSVIAGSALHVYTKAEQRDHFLALKNPEQFATDLRGFLDKC
jgi:non-heme chloroperoxidase